MAYGLDVYVVDNSTGQPIEGINVGCTQSGTEYHQSQTTPANGIVRFTGLQAVDESPPGGFVSIVVNQGGYLGYEQLRVDGITIYYGQFTQRTVRLAPNGTPPDPDPEPDPDPDPDPQNYSVEVKDTVGNPIEGATVEGRWYDQADASHNFNVSTNALGRALVFRTPPSNVSHWTILLITAAGYEAFSTATQLEADQHTFTVTLPPESLEGRGVVLGVDPRVTEISPGQTIQIWGEIKNEGAADNIKIVWGLFQPSPFIAIQTREVAKQLAAQESFQVDESFTLPEGYDKDTILVLAAGYHEE